MPVFVSLTERLPCRTATINNYSPFIMNFLEKYMKTSSIKIVIVKMESTEVTACYVTTAQIC